MISPAKDAAFSGSIPAIYQQYLVPLLFEPYAADVTSRLVRTSPRRVLEIAAGTGIVTRAMAAALPKSVEIVATDLNQAMLDFASTIEIARPVEWRAADAMALPFGDAEFDAVVCQFGVMFFPDKSKALAEARRVLRPGGTLTFNVWGRMDRNGIADAVTRAMNAMFPDDPPGFLMRTPYGYYDFAVIERDLAQGGFTAKPRIDTVPARSRAPSALAAATGYCQGTPLRNEIEARGASRLDEATNVAAEELARVYGHGAIDAPMEAHVVTASR